MGLLLPPCDSFRGTFEARSEVSFMAEFNRSALRRQLK
jgi:hypothetical protein